MHTKISMDRAGFVFLAVFHIGCTDCLKKSTFSSKKFNYHIVKDRSERSEQLLSKKCNLFGGVLDEKESNLIKSNQAHKRFSVCDYFLVLT